MRAALGLVAAHLLRRHGGRTWPLPEEEPPCNCGCCAPSGVDDRCRAREGEDDFMPPHNLVTCADTCVSRAVRGEEPVATFCANECVPRADADDCWVAPPLPSEVGQTTPPPSWSDVLAAHSGGADAGAALPGALTIPRHVVVKLGAAQVVDNVEIKPEKGAMFVTAVSGGSFPDVSVGDIVVDIVFQGVTYPAAEFAIRFGTANAADVLGVGGTGPDATQLTRHAPDRDGEGKTAAQKLAEEVAGDVSAAEALQKEIDAHAEAAGGSGGSAIEAATRMREHLEGEDWPPYP